MLVAYVVIVNIVALAMMGIDKSRAVNGEWRISERALFTVAIIGGSIGTIVGTYLFRHKTRHTNFVIGIPAILVVQIVLYCIFLR